MSDWEDSYDIGGDGVPDDFDSVADFDDGTDIGGDDFGDFDEDASVGDLVSPVSDADAWIVDLDLGGLADIADIAVVAGVEDVGLPDAGADDLASAAAGGEPLVASLLAHDLTDVPDGSDPFAALVGRRLDDDELRDEIRHLRVKPPFESRAVEETVTPPR
jgi:hypothetical protein